METKSKKLKPIWIVTITIVSIALLMAFGALYFNYRKGKEKTYVDNPKAGDVYEMIDADGYYSTAKVLYVRNDSVFVTVNNMKTDQAKGISEIDIDRNYGILKDAYSKKKLESLFAQDSIFAINRD
ncbi:hypothetical protein [Flavobacterium sp.]|uniref:hypothetical protein n=1 Tax=Flavobacterium sp. TaxID=239 RepID=UPI0026182A85|nr:hypothetical protein [Flavobacterium sp.]